MPSKGWSGSLGVMVSTELASGTGRGRINIPLTRLNIVEFAPVPRARDKTATAVDVASFHSMRMAYRMSLSTIALALTRRLHEGADANRIHGIGADAVAL